MSLGKEVGLAPGHIVLDGDPPPQQPFPTCGPLLLWPNGRPSQQLLSSCSVSGTVKMLLQKNFKRGFLDFTKSAL